MFNNSDRILWVLVDGEVITGVATSRSQARQLKAGGYTGSIHKALVTLI